MQSKCTKYIYFVRHGETDWNRHKQNQGSEVDTELNSTGIEQSSKTGDYLVKYHNGFDAFFASPMRRTVQTATIIADKLSYSRDRIIYDKRLIEKSYDQLTGKTPKDLSTDLKYKLHNDLIQQWKAIEDPIARYLAISSLEEQLYLNYGLETTEAIKKRCQEVIDVIIGSDFNKVLIVTHGYTMKTFMKLLFGLQWELPYGKLVGEGNCMIMLVKYEDGKFYLISAPNNEHLEFIYTHSKLH